MYSSTAVPGPSELPPGQPPTAAWPARPGGPPTGPGAGAVIAAVVVGLWSVALAVLSQYGTWVTEQLMQQLGNEMPAAVWLPIGLGGLLLAGGPALLLALTPRHPAVRATGRAFALGAAALGVGSALRVIPGMQNEFYLLALALLAGTGAILLRRRPELRRGSQRSVDPVDSDAGPRNVPGAIGWAMVAGLVVLSPYLWAGALGGWLETLAAGLAAFAVGSLTAAILGGRSDPGRSSTRADFWSHFGGGGRARLVLLGGLVAGVTLAMIAAGTGASGVQLLELLVLPPLGFALAALAPASPGGTATRVMIGLAVFGPLAFVDPDEFSLNLYDQDVPYWAGLAGLLALLVGLVLGLGYGLGLLRTVRPADPVGAPVPGRRVVVPRLGGRAVPAAVAAVVLLGAGAVYAGASPGFYGDQLFVVLKDQSPLAGLPTTTGVGPGRDKRVAAVYRRLVEHAETTQAPLRAELDRWHLTYRPYYLVNAILVTGGPEVRAWLAGRADVDRVLLDQRLRPLPRPREIGVGQRTAAPAKPRWNVEMVGAPAAWAKGVTGRGIVVGGSDSGVDGTHPALSANFRGGDDSWLDPWSASPAPVDHNGHGTHTMATAVGGKNVGVAPGAQWVGCVNLDRNLGSPSFYLDCMQFMLAPYPQGTDPFTAGRPARAPHVLTNSWGCPALEGCDLTLLRPATAAFAAAGIAFVAAAGNTGPDCGSIDTPPGTDPAAITVAAVDQARQVTGFSSRGNGTDRKPDVAAPGAGVLSAMPGATYAELDGTSMATPHVAGVIALLWSAHPELVGDLDRTMALLHASAAPAAPTGGPCGAEADTGAGIVNAEAALTAAERYAHRS